MKNSIKFSYMRLKRTVVIIVGFLALLQPLMSSTHAQAKPKGATLDAKRLKKLTSQLDSYAAKKQLAGGVIMVAHKGNVAYKHAFGYRDVESSSKMTEDAIFRIASQTKAIVSVGAMILKEQGKLSLSDPVSKFLPEFANTTVAVPTATGYEIVKAKRQITIQDLLTHTSGFGYGTGLGKDKWEAACITNWYFANRDEPMAATVARIAKLPAEAQPGEKFVYGYSTDILGVVIEKISGESLDHFVHEHILDPLGMTDTQFYLAEDKVNRLATVYSLNANSTQITRAPDTGTTNSQGAYVNGPRKSFSGGAGLLSTASDYMRFLLMLRNGGELDGKRIISSESVREMTTDHLGSVPYSPGQGFGLGFAITKETGSKSKTDNSGEYGWGGAYHSVYWVDPKNDLVVVYLTQLIPAGNLADQAKVRELLYKAIKN